MKKVIQTVAVLISFALADTIILLNGQEIQNATITEISETEVKYKIGERAVVYSAKKDGIAKISYPDGTEDVFASIEAEPIAAPPPQIPVAAPVTAAPANIAAPISTAVAQPAASEKGGVRFVTGVELGMTSVSLGVSTATGYKWSGDAGYKFALSGGANIPISSIASFRPSADFFYRTYNINIKWSDSGYQYENNVDFKELGLGISALFHTMLTDKLHQELGLKLDFPFSCNVDYEYKDGRNSGSNVDETFSCSEFGKEDVTGWGTRELFDLGLVFGFGYSINENISVGFRGIINFMNTYSKIGYKVNQYGLGVYYSL